MSHTEFNRVVILAKSKVPLAEYATDILIGYGCADFQQVSVTLAAAAECLRWQCSYIFGGWNEEEMNNTLHFWVKKNRVLIVGDGSDDAAALPGRLLAQALGVFDEDKTS